MNPYIFLGLQKLSYLIRKHTQLSLREIGQFLGNKTHATVLNSIKRINEYLLYDKEYKELFNQLDLSELQ